MSDITIEGKNLHDIDQTNFQSVGPYTDENEVVELKKGSLYGEKGLIAGRRRTATVVAMRECF